MDTKKMLEGIVVKMDGSASIKLTGEEFALLKMLTGIELEVHRKHFDPHCYWAPNKQLHRTVWITIKYLLEKDIKQ